MKDRKDAIGFVFSGGGLQGIAHIGAVTALYELGIRPEYVSGTSSGSIMAMLVAMGLEPKEMHEVAKKYWKIHQLHKMASFQKELFRIKPFQKVLQRAKLYRQK